jgi:hypothetical protein
MRTIYAILDPQTAKVRYVGSTTLPVKRRIQLHWTNRMSKTTPVSRWIRHFDKEPPFQVLDIVDEDDGDRVEEIWIAWMRQFPDVQLLNVSMRASGGNNTGRGFGFTVTPETRAKIGRTRRERGLTYPHRRKLTDEDIHLIREATGRQVDIARQFGISQAAVSYIKHGRTNRKPGRID